MVYKPLVFHPPQGSADLKARPILSLKRERKNIPKKLQLFNELHELFGAGPRRSITQCKNYIFQCSLRARCEELVWSLHCWQSGVWSGVPSGESSRRVTRELVRCDT